MHRLKSHSETVGQAAHSLPSLAPEASLSEGERKSRQNKKSNKNIKREHDDDRDILLRIPKMVVKKGTAVGCQKHTRASTELSGFRCCVKFKAALLSRLRRELLLDSCSVSYTLDKRREDRALHQRLGSRAISKDSIKIAASTFTQNIKL